MEYTNGINLIRDIRKVEVDYIPSPDSSQSEIPNKVGLNCLWKVVQYTDGHITAIYHTPYIYLKPMPVVLSNDEKSYWITDAIVYDYQEVKLQITGYPKPMTLYIGKKSKVEKLIDIESIKLCYQEKLDQGKKTTRKRTKVVNPSTSAISDTALS